jgi:hypothetical protein
MRFFSFELIPDVPEEVPGKLDEKMAVRPCRRCVGGGEHASHHAEDLLERVQARRLATQRDLKTERWVSNVAEPGNLSRILDPNIFQIFLPQKMVSLSYYFSSDITF